MVTTTLTVLILIAGSNGIAVPRSGIGITDDCFLCEYALVAITKQPQDEMTPAAVESLLRIICDTPGLDTKYCRKRSLQMLTFVADATVGHYSRKTPACDLITGTQCDVRKLGIQPKHSGLECIACFISMNLLNRKLLKYEKTVEEAFKAICNSSILKDRDQKVCVNLLEDHFPQAYAAFVTTLSTKFVCGALIGCPLSGKHGSFKPTSPVDDVECHACEIGFKYVHRFVSKTHPEEAIADGLVFFCSKLMNKELISECNDMIHSYSKELKKAVLHFLEPKIICSKFEFCKSED
uniref:Saposin B-type domain-containing protein n=1 Tax=Trichuris muris TaxID=70415 RepID=A0A5S6QWV0_TRIMR